MLLPTYAAFVKITGEFLIHESYRSLFSGEAPDPFYYYFNFYRGLAPGMCTLYGSLLFIPSNRKFYDEHPEYMRKRAEYDRSQLEINPGRLINIILVILIIFVFVILAARIL